MPNEYFISKTEPVRKTLDLIELITPPDEPWCYINIYTHMVCLEWAASSWDAEPELKRAEALDFLGRWARRFVKLGEVAKTYGDYDTAVTIKLTWGTTLTAKASAEVTCEFVPVIGENGEPLMREEDEHQTIKTGTKLVPVTEKICPPSFLAGARL